MRTLLGDKLAPAIVESFLPPELFDTDAGHAKDGARISVVYESFGEPTTAAISEAAVGTALGIPAGHYTGRLVTVRKTALGDTLIVMMVELERDGKFRSMNVNRGCVRAIKVLDD